jgi:hypothetical protein
VGVGWSFGKYIDNASGDIVDMCIAVSRIYCVRSMVCIDR